MDLAAFIKYQAESKNPFMCINNDHLMPLVAIRNLDLEIELKCFVGYCDFKIKPGLNSYQKVLEEKYDK